MKVQVAQVGHFEWDQYTPENFPITQLHLMLYYSINQVTLVCYFSNEALLSSDSWKDPISSGDYYATPIRQSYYYSINRFIPDDFRKDSPSAIKNSC